MMEKNREKNVKWAVALGWLACQIFLGWGTDRAHFPSFIGAFSLCFLAYIWALKHVKTRSDIHFFLILGLILRGGLIFSMPQLSDDVYRFIWDGRVWYVGGNPFEHLPQYYVDNHLWPEFLTQNLFQQLNSPQYYTVYPPVCQAIFAAAVWLCPNSVYGAVVVLKSCLFLGELGVLFYLYKGLLKWGKPLENILIYALNPLIIIEVMGNVHFEGLMFLGLMMACYYSGALAVWGARLGFILGWFLAISTKILPLLFLPYWPRLIGWPMAIRLGFGLMVVLLLGLWPLYSPVFIAHFTESMGLYFSKFEYNASVYYLGKAFHEAIYGYNMPTRVTFIWRIITLVFIVYTAFFRPARADTEGGGAALYFWAVVVYFLGATTVHPWYVIGVVGLSVWTPWRFPLLWSWLIAFTYSGYTEGSSVHTENFWVVGAEYILTFIFFLIEYKRQFSTRKLHF